LELPGTTPGSECCSWYWHALVSPKTTNNASKITGIGLGERLNLAKR
jgi:hypothetical protein